MSVSIVNGTRNTRFGLQVVVVCLTLLTPSAVSADGIFTPFVGTSFWDEDTEKVTTWGLSLAAMAGGVFGFELDFGRTARATANSVFAETSQITTVTGNIIIGAPIKGVRPYILGGVGWLRADVTAAEADQRTRADGLGVDMGGGLMGFFGERVGVRFDLRYIRGVSQGENLLDFQLGKQDFLRASVGLALKF